MPKDFSQYSVIQKYLLIISFIPETIVGFPYWPAKVMRILEGEQSHDVRFFGGYHQRALVEKSHIRPISVNIHTLQVKRTSLWNKACEELRKHQEFIAKVQQNPEFLKEPFGDPFAAEDLKAQLGGGEDDSDDSESNYGDDTTNHDATAMNLPFYSDGEDEDSDGDTTASRKTKAQKLDLKNNKKSHQKTSSSLNSSSSTNGNLQQNQPLATAIKTAPPPIVQSTMISPPPSGGRAKRDESKGSPMKNKKLSKKKQKELQLQQQMLLAEAAAKANVSIAAAKENGSSPSKKKRGRPKKAKTEEGSIDASAQPPLLSSQTAVAPQQVINKTWLKKHYIEGIHRVFYSFYCYLLTTSHHSLIHRFQ